MALQSGSASRSVQGRRHWKPGLIAAALFGASAAVLAEPLSVVQTLRDGTDGTSLSGGLYGLSVTDDQVVVLTGDLALLYDRDAASGQLDLLDTLLDYDNDTEVPTEGDVRLSFDINLLDNGLLVASGGFRHPSMCDVRSSCEGLGPVSLSTDTGEFVLEAFSDVGRPVTRLSVSPDGRYAYAGKGDELTVYTMSDRGEATLLQAVEGIRLDGGREFISNMAHSRDSRYLFVHTFTEPSARFGEATSYITTFRRDEENGELTAVSEINAATEPGNIEKIPYTKAI